MNEPAPGRTLLLGLGNPIMGDDGFGLAVLARLQAGWVLPPTVEPVDGGTWGMSLLPLVEDAERLLVLDAVNLDLAAGTPVVLDRSAIPRYLARQLSPHQIALQDVLALAELRGTLPGEFVAIGAQPASVELRSGLSAPLADRVEEIASLAAAQLERWGHACPRARKDDPA